MGHRPGVLVGHGPGQAKAGVAAKGELGGQVPQEEEDRQHQGSGEVSLSRLCPGEVSHLRQQGSPYAHQDQGGVKGGDPPQGLPLGAVRRQVGEVLQMAGQVPHHPQQNGPQQHQPR